MTKTQFAEAVGRRLATIETELKGVYENGQDCPWCHGLCQCDGDWSAESSVRHLEEEKVELMALNVLEVPSGS